MSHDVRFHFYGSMFQISTDWWSPGRVTEPGRGLQSYYLSSVATHFMLIRPVASDEFRARGITPQSVRGVAITFKAGDVALPADAGGSPPVVLQGPVAEVMFDDGSGEPFAVYLSGDLFDPELLTLRAAGRGYTLGVYVAGAPTPGRPGHRDGVMVGMYCCNVRSGKRGLPDLRPWHEID